MIACTVRYEIDPDDVTEFETCRTAPRARVTRRHVSGDPLCAADTDRAVPRPDPRGSSPQGWGL